MIASELVAAFDSGAGSNNEMRWRSFSLAVLDLVFRMSEQDVRPREIAADALAAWEIIPVDVQRLADLRTLIWRLFNDKRGNSWEVSDLEDRLLRVALFGLQPQGDRDAAMDGAGWVEDFLSGSVGQ